MAVSVTKLVLECDGTEIDGDDELVAFAGSVVLGLKEGEQWTSPATADVTVGETEPSTASIQPGSSSAPSVTSHAHDATALSVPSQDVLQSQLSRCQLLLLTIGQCCICCTLVTHACLYIFRNGIVIIIVNNISIIQIRVRMIPWFSNITLKILTIVSTSMPSVL